MTGGSGGCQRAGRQREVYTVSVSPAKRRKRQRIERGCNKVNICDVETKGKVLIVRTCRCQCTAVRKPANKLSISD